MTDESKNGEAGKGRGGSGGARFRREASIDKRLCVTVPEAAAMLGVSRNFGYELVKQGQLPAIRLGKRILIPRIALEKRLAEAT